MKVIFLDIDGVLIHKNYENKAQENIDESKIVLLKEIVDATSSKIVLISNWRVYNKEKTDKYPYSLLEKLLKKYGLEIYADAPLFDQKVIKRNVDQKTGRCINIEYDPYTTRSGEIYSYLKNNDDIENYLIIDDDSSYHTYFEFDDNFIKTDIEQGLTEENVYDAIEILNSKKRKMK